MMGFSLKHSKLFCSLVLLFVVLDVHSSHALPPFARTVTKALTQRFSISHLEISSEWNAVRHSMEMDEPDSLDHFLRLLSRMNDGEFERAGQSFRLWKQIGRTVADHTYYSTDFISSYFGALGKAVRRGDLGWREYQKLIRDFLGSDPALGRQSRVRLAKIILDHMPEIEELKGAHRNVRQYAGNSQDLLGVHEHEDLLDGVEVLYQRGRPSEGRGLTMGPDPFLTSVKLNDPWIFPRPTFLRDNGVGRVKIRIATAHIESLVDQVDYHLDDLIEAFETVARLPRGSRFAIAEKAKLLSLFVDQRVARALRDRTGLVNDWVLRLIETKNFPLAIRLAHLYEGSLDLNASTRLVLEARGFAGEISWTDKIRIIDAVYEQVMSARSQMDIGIQSSKDWIDETLHEFARDRGLAERVRDWPAGANEVEWSRVVAAREIDLFLKVESRESVILEALATRLGEIARTLPVGE